MSGLRQSPSYLDWLKSQKWDGQLPLVVEGGAGETPFISIPSARNGSANVIPSAGNGSVNVTTAE